MEPFDSGTKKKKKEKRTTTDNSSELFEPFELHFGQ